MDSGAEPAQRGHQASRQVSQMIRIVASTYGNPRGLGIETDGTRGGNMSLGSHVHAWSSTVIAQKK